VAYAYNKDGYSKGTGFSILLKPIVKLFDFILFSKIRAAFGGELEFFVGGGALLDAELQRFFYAIGIPMYQGYGLSEATPVISSNCPRVHKFGSSGIPVTPMQIVIKDAEGNDLPIGESGEIVIRGENVMAGYWKNPEATAETIKNGWLYTGDLGYLTKEGLLYVLGRFKSLLISSDGEKYSPEGMEEAMVAQSPYIEQIILHNNQDPYTIALIVPDKEAIRKHLLHHHKYVDSKKAIELIQHELNKYKHHGEYAGIFPERWLPTSFIILPEAFTEQNGMINSTLKIVRNKVESHYQNRISYEYTADGKDIFNAQNLQCIQK
jgi:long-chain acyl-CoA synthetase